jgi:hypothetical protein
MADRSGSHDLDKVLEAESVRYHERLSFTCGPSTTSR